MTNEEADKLIDQHTQKKINENIIFCIGGKEIKSRGFIYGDFDRKHDSKI